MIHEKRKTENNIIETIKLKWQIESQGKINNGVRIIRKQDKTEALSSHITAIPNVNGFNSLIKRHRVAGWIKR